MWRPYLADWHVVLACVSSVALVPGSIHSVRALEMLLAGHVAIGVTSESSHHLPAPNKSCGWADGIEWASGGSQRAVMGLQRYSRHGARRARDLPENLQRLVGMLGDLLTYQALAPQGLWFRKNLSFALYAYLSCPHRVPPTQATYAKTDVARLWILCAPFPLDLLLFGLDERLCTCTENDAHNVRT